MAKEISPRYTAVSIKYNNKDITKDLEPYMLSLGYTDNASSRADDLQLKLEDRQGIWLSDWFPEHGATLTAAIIAHNWEYEGSRSELPCGQFEIDSIDPAGAPATISIKAASLPIKGSLTDEDKTRSWEKVRLSVVAKDIAGGAKMELFYDTDDDPDYDRLEQSDQSDLSFLQKCCDDEGLSLKITDKKIVIFDDRKYEQMEPVMTINKETCGWLSYSGSSSVKETYKSCHVKYRKSKDDAFIDYHYKPAIESVSGKVLKINEQVEDIAHAERLAKKRLRQKNKEADKFSIDLPGNTKLLSGLTVMLKGWGKFDGKWFIDTANHDWPTYKTKLELRKVLKGY